MNRQLGLLFILGWLSVQGINAEQSFPGKIDQCVACHGALGQSSYGFFPNIAGQKKTYLVNQLRAFRDGSRSNPWMTPIALPLQDDEIEKLADFYSQL